jgi:hypothetical protein
MAGGRGLLFLLCCLVDIKEAMRQLRGTCLAVENTNYVAYLIRTVSCTDRCLIATKGLAKAIMT